MKDHVMTNTKTLNMAGPLGYAAFTLEGVCAIMAITKARAEEVASERGLPVVTLFGPEAVDPLLAALRFYSAGEHFHIDPAGVQYEDCSGEPPNWLFAEDDSASMLEDGSVARHALNQWEALTGHRVQPYPPLTATEIHDLTCMHAGAPWPDEVLAELGAVLKIYDRLRATGARPVDPANVKGSTCHP